MATRRATAGPRRSKKKRPGWALVLLGLALGLAVAGLAYLYSKGGTSKGAGKGAKGERPAAEAARTAKPRFDFYTILPEIESVVPERESKKRAAKPQEGERYVLQAASLANYADADELKAKLALAGLEAHIEKVTIDDKGDFYRVRLGPYSSWQDMEAVDKRLSQLGIKPLLMTLKRAGASR